jgi:hypothetical protein
MEYATRGNTGLLVSKLGLDSLPMIIQRKKKGSKNEVRQVRQEVFGQITKEFPKGWLDLGHLACALFRNATVRKKIPFSHCHSRR